MKLFVMPGACSLASHIALIWAGLPFDLVVLSHADVGEDTYRRTNPNGAVPALVLDDGTVITESLAVLQFIAALAPNKRLGSAPGDMIEQARMNELLAYLVSDVHKAWAPVFVPGRFVTQKSAEDDVRRAAFTQLDILYARLDERMRGLTFALFGRRTVADAYLYVMCSWKDKTRTPLSDFPALAMFKSRLDGHPGVQRALKEEGPISAPASPPAS